MCGIAGRVNFRSRRPVEPSLVQSMCDLLAHRGPDDHGVYTDQHVGLGHRRLSILDLSPSGHQPMADPSRRLWLTFNGEIYNFLEIRRELEQEGFTFCSRSDTEVILAAYAHWGVECLGRLRGMFALGLWDWNTQTLLLARDRVGKKPLHYWLDGDGIAFASEPKAFLADPGFEPAADASALLHYLAYQSVPSPQSAFKGLQKLPPGHFLLVRDGKVDVQRYWRLNYEPKQKIDERELPSLLLAQIRDAVACRLISDVPLGAFLSGGIDSATVVALMAQTGGGRVKTFSIGFPEEEYDELPFARQVAKRFGTDHHEFVVTPQVHDILPKLVWHYNEPFADPSAIPTYYLSQLTREHVTVALNGDGGDESFGGYTRYLPLSRAAGFWNLPAALRRAGVAASRSTATMQPLPHRIQNWLEINGLGPQHQHIVRSMQLKPTLRAALCTPEFLSAAGAPPPELLLETAFAETDARDHVDAMMAVDVAHYLPDTLLVKVDIASMAHGLEARSPFLDHQLMEFVARLPADAKIRGTALKYALKQAVRGLIPDEIIDRKKKGFSVPIRRWFRQELKGFLYDTLLSSRALQRGYFRPKALRAMLDQHVAGTCDWHDELWNLSMLELWHQRFIDQKR